MTKMPPITINFLQDLYRKHQAEIREDYLTFLRFQSISSEPPFRDQVNACATWLTSYLAAAGLTAECWQTSGHPVVYAEWLGAGKDKPTVLIYNHYDVQPVDPLELWNSPPFEPRIEGDEVYARGAQDNKGQCFYVVSVIKALLKSSKQLPVNVKLCIEGEEECGSKALNDILPAKREKLRADHLLIVDLGMPTSETPAVTLGIRGIVTMTVEVHGSSSDLHSGTHGGVVYNPNHALVEILAKLHDANGRVNIPGFYDAVKEPTAEEQRQIDFRFDDALYERQFGAKATGGEKDRSPLQSAWLRPTVEINGLGGGYCGDGFKTVIPAVAKAKVSCRLVPDQDPAKIGKLMADFIERLAPDGVKVKVKIHAGGGRPVRTPPTSPVVRVAAQAYSELFGKPCHYILEGGSIPIVTELASTAGADVVLMGFGLPTDNVHAPNEHFGMARLERGFATIGRILELLGA